MQGSQGGALLRFPPMLYTGIDDHWKYSVPHTLDAAGNRVKNEG